MRPKYVFCLSVKSKIFHVVFNSNETPYLFLASKIISSVVRPLLPSPMDRKRLSVSPYVNLKLNSIIAPKKHSAWRDVYNKSSLNSEVQHYVAELMMGEDDEALIQLIHEQVVEVLNRIHDKELAVDMRIIPNGFEDTVSEFMEHINRLKAATHSTPNVGVRERPQHLSKEDYIRRLAGRSVEHLQYGYGG